ncbi:LolA family protein [Pseudoteredinibacter isoporae]|uniref:LolA family protein n=1 Tax=Pseudoteredinibacter isoporae TaxID=570281 RepID=UPI00310385DC
MKMLLTSLLTGVFFLSGTVCSDDIQTKLQQQLSGIEMSPQGQFRQENQLQGIPFPIKSSGQYEFSAGILSWKNLKPVESMLVLTENKVEQYIAGEKSFSVRAEQQPILRTINQLFLSLFEHDWQALSENFELQLIQHGEQWEVQMHPKQDALKAAILSARVYGDVKIRRFEFTKSNNDQTRIWFSDENK